MSASFSQRYNYRPIKQVIQIESIDADLRAGLWNVLTEVYWSRISRYERLREDKTLEKLVKILWSDFFKVTIDKIGIKWDTSLDTIRKFFFDENVSWFILYDFIEFIANNTDRYLSDKFETGCNEILERELSGYRFINGLIAPITNEAEINEIEEAVMKSKFGSEHLSCALDLLSNRSNPDYRNSIKESISAVESIAKHLSGEKKAELKQALSALEGKLGVQIHGALKSGFLKIYGYTSDEGGIRHGLTDEPDLSLEDAKFMLVACSAFVNYLIIKADKAGISIS